VRCAFMRLPEEQRAALHLVAIEGLTFAEAASALDIPAGTLMSRLARARATLRAIEDGPVEKKSDGTTSRYLRIVGGSDGTSR
jgi:DNA-directed RNA polymerase specialized sigma24 family protein